MFSCQDEKDRWFAALSSTITAFVDPDILSETKARLASGKGDKHYQGNIFGAAMEGRTQVWVCVVYAGYSGRMNDTVKCIIIRETWSCQHAHVSVFV